MSTTQAPTDALLLTMKQTGVLLSVSERTIFTMLKEGTLPSVRIGAAVRIPKSAIVDFIDRAVKGAPTQ